MPPNYFKRKSLRLPSLSVFLVHAHKWQRLQLSPSKQPRFFFQKYLQGPAQQWGCPAAPRESPLARLTPPGAIGGATGQGCMGCCCAGGHTLLGTNITCCIMCTGTIITSGAGAGSGAIRPPPGEHAGDGGGTAMVRGHLFLMRRRIRGPGGTSPSHAPPWLRGGQSGPQPMPSVGCSCRSLHHPRGMLGMAAGTATVCGHISMTRRHIRDPSGAGPSRACLRMCGS